MISVTVFLVMAGVHFKNPQKPSVFDPAWSMYGFCITDPQSLFWSSHFMCLYFDTAATIVMGVIYYFYIYKRPTVVASITEYINNMYIKAIPGVLLHGVAHGGLGVQLHGSLQGIALVSVAHHPANPLLVILLVFWFFLLRTALPESSVVVVAFAAVVAFAFQVLYVPLIFSFTYVQTVILILMSSEQLLLPASRKQNNLAYSLYPWLVAFPLSLVAWMESTQCTAFVRAYFYGHTIYDAYIPTSVVAWYFISYFSQGNVRPHQP
jgi:hypothetical protein